MKVIFAIDDGASLRVRARFLRFLDENRVMGKFKGEPRTCIGRWEDNATGDVFLDPSYCLDVEDYKSHIVPHGWVNKQKCVMLVEGAHSVASLAGPANLSQTTPIGIFTCVGRVMPTGDWTRFDDTNDFWVAK